MDLTWLYIGLGLSFVSFIVALMNMLLNNKEGNIIHIHILCIIGMASGGVIVLINIITIGMYYLNTLTN